MGKGRGQDADLPAAPPEKSAGKCIKKVSHLDVPSYYAVIPANVRYSKEISANAKLLYGEISALTSERGYCWATNATLGKYYGYSADSVSRWVNELEGAGFIVCETLKDKGNQRRIRLALVDKPVDKPVDDDAKNRPNRVSAKLPIGGYRQNCREGIGKIAEHSITRVVGRVDKLHTTVIPPTPKASKNQNPATRDPYRPTHRHLTFGEWKLFGKHECIPEGWVALGRTLLRKVGGNVQELERQVERFEDYYLHGAGEGYTSEDWMAKFFEWLRGADSNRKRRRAA